MEPGASGKQTGVRVSQRRPQACRECTKQKRKCDKRIPCSRCRRLNIECSVEVVQLRRNGVHVPEIQFLKSILTDLESASMDNKMHSIAERVRGRIRLLHPGESIIESEASITVMDHDKKGLQDCIPAKSSPSSDHTPSNNVQSSLLTEIEHLAWGRNSAGCYPHRRCVCPYRKDDRRMLSLNEPLQIRTLSLGSTYPAITRMDAEKLVRFHICHMAWHHNCMHGPTFLEQCESFWERGIYEHPLWLALYYSVLSCTVNSIQNSRKARELVDINLHTVPPAHQFFSTMMQILYSSHFLGNVSIYSIQAIIISTEVAHNLGFSQLNANLFSAAVRIAECLGLHKIEDHAINIAQTKDEWEERVEREVGKRIWCQMLVQDHFAIPFTDSYSISPMHFLTSRPMNANDYDLVDRPADNPTISTYVCVLVRLAELMPSLLDGLGLMKRRNSLREQYDHILKVDQRMRSIVRDMPSFLLRQDKAKETQIPWLGIARRSLAISAAEKIIMIHRPFLFRSFHDPVFKYTRRTCVAAAMTILREHETIVGEEDLFIWTHTAFAITGAVILCFEMNALSEQDRTLAQQYREAIVAARTRLGIRKHDALAQRGVALIDAIFMADSGSSRTDNGFVNFNHVLSNFSILSMSVEKLNPPEHSIHRAWGDNLGCGIDVDNESQPVWDQEGDGDFNDWFNGIFHTLQ
ncbi:hypothetical protein BJY01DRAFT_238977 [Aspergillus pseudoustus]|uniref:Zn(2)-C6 fungal-type domain-containing protein n=1 Tax=Aspergillus pseudoustus TaxID=1810923 RepID=A0ABR4J426_9EURO